ncbi:N-acetylmannosamine-6-phosphate 2-epimerase [Kribbella sindirgiensis]|uniref:Putative N-acetylmannosamine-6-phosphate 2-epimerase n=1 Tax=Kribbella sindirgiensis TaxID=1124744 RepID=A0A4R0IHW9_9ACTN|nr:N-acetylmannosamine-6-phosphate 2-epimerase [Kribbella sindirgiensis]TCC32229.1 N-acetylmannosamine-6-phosphate 2-epimerase [Kribbella sindirgiensis]
MIARTDDSRLASLKGRLVVSCQAYPGEPMRSPTIMAAVAQAVVEGGAQGIRAQGIEDLKAIRPLVDVCLIGLVKRGSDGVFITPTVADALDCVTAGADIVAVDGTRRDRPDGQPLAATIAAVHAADALVMADCGSLDDALYSISVGADCVGTTLAGYTGARPVSRGPDLELLAELVAHVSVPVIAEGRVRNPDDALACLNAGAYAVVVGTAITHPTRIARTFADQLAHGARRSDPEGSR